MTVHICHTHKKVSKWCTGEVKKFIKIYQKSCLNWFITKKAAQSSEIM